MTDLNKIRGYHETLKNASDEDIQNILSIHGDNKVAIVRQIEIMIMLNDILSGRVK